MAARHAILWSGPALEDLRQIREHVRRDNPAAAGLLAGRIRDRISNLRDHPFAGRKVPELEATGFREVIVSPFRIVYQVAEEKKVVVLRVWHGRRDLESLGVGKEQE